MIRKSLTAFRTMTIFSIILVAAAVAQDYDVPWSTVGGGMMPTAGGGFELAATIGQPDAGTLSGGGFELHGGFWPGSSTSPCPGDVDGDDEVNILDLLAVLAQWGPCSGCDADINQDEQVDIQDLLVLLSGWGPC